MIRKAIIAVLTLATIGSAWVCGANYGGFYSRRLTLGQTELVFEVNGDDCVFGLYQPERKRPFGTHWRWLGNRFILDDFKTDTLVLFPAWIPPVLFGAYPLFALLRIKAHRRRRRREQGRCVECGYDLTGNVTGVCSECGTEIEKP